MSLDLTKLLFYLLLWTIFGFVHSILTMKHIKIKLGLSQKTYRIMYNIINTIVLLSILYYLPSITVLIFNGLELTGIKYYLFLFFIILGTIITIIGGLQWDLLGFLGLKNEDSPLNTGGIYRLSRHPVYLGIIIIFISTLFVSIDENSLSWVMGAGGYFVIGSIPEEIKLNNFFPEYQEYKRKVGTFFPWKRKHMCYLFGKIS